MHLSPNEKQKRKQLKREYLEHEYKNRPAILSTEFCLDMRDPIRGTSFFQTGGDTYIDHTTIGNEKKAARFRPLAG